jgi:glutathione synthase/RimK-type ligase-like ATP-grasp enzyme
LQAGRAVFNMPSIFRPPDFIGGLGTADGVKGESGDRPLNGPSSADRTLLVLGDEKDWDSYNKFRSQLFNCDPLKLASAAATYEQFEAGELPPIMTASIIIYLFFPHAYWDKHIENDTYEGIYGNAEFYIKFRALWDKINARLSYQFKDKLLYYVNHPLRISVDRDKELTKAVLKEAGIDVPASVFTRNLDEIIDLVERQGEKLYLKVRYGSMGKGITYMERGRWLTNFRFIDGKIVSRHSDSGWTFIDVTGRTDFIKELLTKDIVVEEAVVSPIVDGRKFDLRFYVCLGKVLYIYARTNDAGAVTTNISQGGIGKDPSFLNFIPAEMLAKMETIAVMAAEKMGLGFAGVDIMLSENMDRAYVIELNAFPGFPPMQKYPRFNLSEKIINRIQNHRFEGE